MTEYQIDKRDQLITINPKQHKHTLIWIHGLGSYPVSDLNALIEVLGDYLKNVKVLIPCAPTRYVTVTNSEDRSWFDIKFRGKESFQVPFDEAFSSVQVIDSFDRILKPIIDSQREILNKNNQKGILIVAGFSQGCGLALHCLYESQKVDCALGVSGYLFPFTRFDSQLKKPKRIIYGLADNLRPWQFTKLAYQGKIGDKYLRLVQEMGHQLSAGALKQMKKFLTQIFES